MLRQRRWRAPSPTSSLPFEALTRSHEGAAQIRWATVDPDGIHQNLCNPMWPLSAVSDLNLLPRSAALVFPSCKGALLKSDGGSALTAFASTSSRRSQDVHTPLLVLLCLSSVFVLDLL